MSYELHISHDLGVSYLPLNYDKIVDKDIRLFREWSLKTSPMLNYTHFVIIGLNCI